MSVLQFGNTLHATTAYDNRTVPPSLPTLPYLLHLPILYTPAAYHNSSLLVIDVLICKPGILAKRIHSIPFHRFSDEK